MNKISHQFAFFITFIFRFISKIFQIKSQFGVSVLYQCAFLLQQIQFIFSNIW